MKYFTFTILLTLLLSACQNTTEEKKTLTKSERLEALNETKKIEYPYNVNLIDTFENGLILDTLTYKREAQFSPLYIGKIKNAIKLTYKTSNLKYKKGSVHNYIDPKPSDFSIFIDTTRTIGFSMPINEQYKKTVYRANKKSYPVFIKNTSAKTLQIGIGAILFLKTEAKDSKGNWHEIEEDYMYFCGTGLRRFHLNSNEIAITALRQNYGRYKTKFRIKFGGFEDEIYSNEIDGYLDFEL